MKTIFKTKNSPSASNKPEASSSRKDSTEYGTKSNQAITSFLKKPVVAPSKSDPDCMEAAFSKNTPKESPYFSSSSSGSGSVKSKSSTVKEDPFFTDIDASKKLTSSVFNSKSSNTNNSGYKEDPFFMETLFPSANTKKAVKKLGKKENVVIKPAQQSIDQLLVNSHKRFQLDENIREANKAMEFMAKLKANSQKPIDITDMTLEEKEEDDQEDMQKHIEGLFYF